MEVPKFKLKVGKFSPLPENANNRFTNYHHFRFTALLTANNTFGIYMGFTLIGKLSKRKVNLRKK